MDRPSARVRFFSVSDVGRVRSGNQDYFGNKEKLSLFLVADGMGGHVGGERASRLAVDTILKEYDIDGMKNPGSKEIGNVLKEAIRCSGRVIHEDAAENYDRHQMGTTIVALILHGRQAILGHVGDSRIYRLRDSEMEQLTVDHSVVQEQIDAGIISAEESEDHKFKNVITRALGIESDVEPEINVIRIEKDDVFLLCSDGLHGMVPDAEIAEAIRTEPDIEKCCRNLVRLANAKGGKDNVTVTLVKVIGLPREGIPPFAKSIAIPVTAAACVAVLVYLVIPLLKPGDALTPGHKSSQPSDGIIAHVPETQEGSASVKHERGPVPTTTHSATDSERAVSETPEEPVSPQPPQEPDIETKIRRLKNLLKDEELPTDTRAANMIALAAAEIENGNEEEARAITEEFVSFCIANANEFNLSDVQDWQLEQLLNDSWNRAWAVRLEERDKRLSKNQKDDLEQYALEKLYAAMAKYSEAEDAFEDNSFLRALDLLDDADNQIDAAIAVSNKKKLVKKAEAENILLEAKKKLDEMASIGEREHSEVGRQLKIREERQKQQRILRKAELDLEEGQYERCLKQARRVLARTEQVIIRAGKLAKQIQVAEQEKKLVAEARAVSAAVEKKWSLINSGQVREIAVSFQMNTYMSLEAGHKEFQNLMQREQHEKAVSLGAEFVTQADSYVRDTAASLEQEIDATGRDLESKKNSDEFIYDRKELSIATALLDKARILIDGRSFSDASEEAKKLRELIDNLKREPKLSSSELGRYVEASEKARNLEAYLKRSVDFLEERKRPQAKSMIQDHSKKKFNELSVLIPPGQGSLRKLLDEAYKLCFSGKSLPKVREISQSMEKVSLLNRRLQEIITANQTVR